MAEFVGFGHKGTIPEAVSLSLVSWSPLRKMLEHGSIHVAMRLRGNGLGTYITELMENLARELGAEKFAITTIVNKQWQEHLLKHGFTQEEDGVVYKLLRP